MRLWTFHKPDFDLTHGRVGWTRSAYFNDPELPRIPGAYRRLGDLLRTTQFIWCYADDGEHDPATAHDELEYELDVPDGDILAWLDSHAWSKLCRGATGPTKAEYERFRADAFRRFPVPRCDNERTAYMDDCYAELNRPETDDELWARLFVTSAHPGPCTALLRHPIAAGWIVRKQLHRHSATF